MKNNRKTHEIKNKLNFFASQTSGVGKWKIFLVNLIVGFFVFVFYFSYFYTICLQQFKFMDDGGWLLFVGTANNECHVDVTE